MLITEFRKIVLVGYRRYALLNSGPSLPRLKSNATQARQPNAEDLAREHGAPRVLRNGSPVARNTRGALRKDTMGPRATCLVQAEAGGVQRRPTPELASAASSPIRGA